MAIQQIAVSTMISATAGEEDKSLQGLA